MHLQAIRLHAQAWQRLRAARAHARHYFAETAAVVSQRHAQGMPLMPRARSCMPHASAMLPYHLCTMHEPICMHQHLFCTALDMFMHAHNPLAQALPALHMHASARAIASVPYASPAEHMLAHTRCMLASTVRAHAAARLSLPLGAPRNTVGDLLLFTGNVILRTFEALNDAVSHRTVTPSTSPSKSDYEHFLAALHPAAHAAARKTDLI